EHAAGRAIALHAEVLSGLPSHARDPTMPWHSRPESARPSHSSQEEGRMNLKPLGDRLIVEVLDEEELTFSGIVLPDTAKEKPQRGRVLAVGPGSRNDKGDLVPLDVVVGDEV